MFIKSLNLLRRNHNLIKLNHIHQARSFNKLKATRSFPQDKDGVREYVSLLTHTERRLLYDELHQIYQPQAAKGVEENVESDSLPPSSSQLRLVFIHQALPFIGFGFLDNFIMIVAGDYIDAHIGVTFGISTMAAAGLGNCLSDIAGLGSAWYVEQLAAKVGVKSPNLSIQQAEMSRTRWTIQYGRAIGITIGCLIGMLPLLFLPSKDKDKDKEVKLDSSNK